MRYLDKYIKNDLKEKMVLLAGPRQCGKTTLAKSLIGLDGIYLNYDVTRDRKVIRDVSWLKDAPLVVLDELHKMPKWKNYLKGLVDEFKNSPRVLVTGSARLDVLSKSGDALTGRQFMYRLHPFDFVEAQNLFPKMSQATLFTRLLKAGGFPESFLNPEKAARLMNDRLELVVKGDVRDISKISFLTGVLDLIELLRERVGKPINYDSLSQDLKVSPPTVKNWVQILEQLYIIFLVRPYSSSGSAISIRKEQRVYFYDSSAAFDKTEGAQIENLVACSLLKWGQFMKDTQGQNWQLYYLRDKQDREVDFVMTKNRTVEYLIEVKKSDDKISNGLAYYKEKLKVKNAVQLVLELDREKEKNGIKVLALGDFLVDTFKYE